MICFSAGGTIKSELLIKTISMLQGEKQINETLLRGVYKKVFFNPGLADRNRGKGNKFNVQSQLERTGAKNR